ncbi:MAG: ABC transporter ATP-binding protein [Proteobacteria bacterium]|nr:ABC transporter ATP-binding protein [Pseudomonadota bacterium]
MEPKLAIRNLSKRFGDLQALEGINLEIAEHEFVCIVGPSGCGKTTLLRIIAGLETANGGEILIDGKGVRAPGADRGFVFQADSLLPWRTVWKNAVIGLEINGLVSQETREYTRSLLKLVGLEGFDHYYPAQLSGGMRQRVNLARALALNPMVLLMDEPFSALDAQTREIMQSEMLRIWRSGHKTVLFITHQIDEAVYLADRVIVLGRRPGRVKEIVSVDIPRPRELNVKRKPRFIEYVDHIWQLIENDVRDSVIEEGAHRGGRRLAGQAISQE